MNLCLKNDNYYSFNELLIENNIETKDQSPTKIKDKYPIFVV